MLMRTSRTGHRNRNSTPTQPCERTGSLCGPMPFAELTEPGKVGRSLAGVDGVGGHGYALLEIKHHAGCDQGCGSVEEHDVAMRTGDAGDHVIEERCVGFDVAAGELAKLLGCGAGQPGHFRRDTGRFHGGRKNVKRLHTLKAIETEDIDARLKELEAVAEKNKGNRRG